MAPTAPLYVPPATARPYPAIPRIRCDQCGGTEGPFLPAKFAWGTCCACPACTVREKGVTP